MRQHGPIHGVFDAQATAIASADRMRRLVQQMTEEDRDTREVDPRIFRALLGEQACSAHVSGARDGAPQLDAREQHENAADDCECAADEADRQELDDRQTETAILRGSTLHGIAARQRAGSAKHASETCEGAAHHDGVESAEQPVGECAAISHEHEAISTPGDAVNDPGTVDDAWPAEPPVPWEEPVTPSSEPARRPAVDGSLLWILDVLAVACTLAALAASA